MSDITIRADEGCDPDPFLLPDSRWSPLDGGADFRLAKASDPFNAGGLSATHAIETAVTLALFTDKRMPADHPLTPFIDGDPRGWWGDAIDVRADLGETDLGSLLWVFERAPLTMAGISAARWAERLAQEALAPLIDQGVAVRVDAQASVDEIANRMELLVQLYGRAGDLVYSQKFELLWTQIAGTN